MVATATKEKTTKVSQEPNPQERQTNNWFSYTPCSGVTYYSFDKRPRRPAKVEPIAPVVTEAGIP